MLLAEELLLLTLDDRTGKQLLPTRSLTIGLAGAIIAELALLERVGVTGDDSGWWKRGRLTVTDAQPTDEPELDRALALLGEAEGKPVTYLVSTRQSRPFADGVEERLLQRLARAGVLSPEPAKALGLFPITAWPVRDASAKEEILGRLHRALLAGELPAERTACLVALLQATGMVERVVPVQDRRVFRARVKELAEGNWPARAVRTAILEASGEG